MNHEIQLSRKKLSDFDTLMYNISNSYDKMISNFKKENPELTYSTSCYNMLHDFDEDEDEDEFVLKTFLYEEHIPPFKPEFAENVLSKYFTRSEWIFYLADIIENRTHSFSGESFYRNIPEINKYFDVKYPEIVKHIQHSSRLWFRHQESDDQALTMEDSIEVLDTISNINDFKGNSKFKAYPITTAYQHGLSTNNSFFTSDKTFNHYIYSKDKGGYTVHEQDAFVMDANIGLLYFYKGKPCFLVSFFLDKNKNVYIRQIQGQYKARGFKSIGDDWQRDVLSELKSKLSFAPNIYLISGKDFEVYIKHHYGEYYVPEIHDDGFNRAIDMYNRLVVDPNDFVNVHVSIRNGASPIVDETFYRI